jgi:hypothetical protein
MRKAKVIVTDLAGRANKIYHSGDIVTENNFPPGNFDKLVKNGYLKVEEEAAATAAQEENTDGEDPGKNTAPEKTEEGQNSNSNQKSGKRGKKM